MPDVLCQLLKSTPELLARTIREDLTLLPLAFSLVPQCLSDALDKHPEFFLDIAHRKPTLVTKLFTKHPDLLLEPLEANPTVFTNFLLYHRHCLPDLSDPNFDPSHFQIERKRYAEQAQQTEKRMCKFDGQLRLRETLRFQGDRVATAARQVGVATLPPQPEPSSTATANPEKATSVNSPTKETRTYVPTPHQVLSEIARLLVKKITSSLARSNPSAMRSKPMTDFVLDLYLVELGFKSKAQRKLGSLIVGARQCEHESLRCKWFLRLLNITSDNTTATAPLSPHWPTLTDFYMAVLSFLALSESEALDDNTFKQLQQRLEEELVRPFTVPLGRVRDLLDQPLLTRILATKDQRQQLLAAMCDKEALLHSTGAAALSIANEKPSRFGSALTITNPNFTLHLDDVLESIMVAWLEYQERVRNEWATHFQCLNPDGSGVVRFNALADLVSSKLPGVDEEKLVEIYYSCGEDNELGEYYLLVDDFALAMTLLQERIHVAQFLPLLQSEGREATRSCSVGTDS
ncbi:hypothetical protein PINS_up014693 [Pythium insidiosum]|nr:hypothetical protein PINS_up014693 [Pythium insidiosum]